MKHEQRIVGALCSGFSLAGEMRPAARSEASSQLPASETQKHKPKDGVGGCGGPSGMFRQSKQQDLWFERQDH